jgi:hypothetical protein
VFLAFLLRVVEGASLRSMFMLIPALSYTIAHQGLRSTPVWILFGVFVCIKQLQRAASAQTVDRVASPRIAHAPLTP